jgi:glutamyl-tRNA synthetase
MLAVVVDDHDMGITHVIRGDDHLTNAARQTQIYQALGWDVPVFAHIPLLHGADGAKLSKRHGALGVDAYRAMGYLPQAVRNYLVRLGWSHGDQEIFADEEMIRLFDLDRVGRSPSRVDFVKLANINGQYMRATGDAGLLAAIDALVPHLPDAGFWREALAGEGRAHMLALLPALKERAKTLVELLDGARFLFVPRPLVPDDKARALLTPEAVRLVAQLAGVLATVEPWSAATTEAAVRATAEAEGHKLGALAQPLRAALTGRATSPPVFDVLAVLGRDESLARLRDVSGV